MPRQPPRHRAPRAAATRQHLTRPSAARRGYDRRWRKLRRMVLAATPICETEGCERAATDVHHIRRLAAGGDDTLDNLQALCHVCHSKVTGRMKGKERGAP